MRVAFVEDDPVLHRSLQLIFGGEPGIELVGSWSSGEKALVEAPRVRPEVMLVDLGLPGVSGVEVVRQLKEALPALDLVALTVFEDRGHVLAALRAGASGYLLKGASPRELVESVHAVRQGGAPMTPRIARAVLRELQSGPTDDDLLITEREREILGGLERGCVYRQIAAELGISEHTVHTHVKKIYSKLQARDRKEALQRARRRGVI